MLIHNTKNDGCWIILFVYTRQTLTRISIILGNYVAASGRVDTKTFENSNCGILNSRNLPFKAISPKQEHVSRLLRCVKWVIPPSLKLKVTILKKGWYLTYPLRKQIGEIDRVCHILLFSLLSRRLQATIQVCSLTTF